MRWPKSNLPCSQSAYWLGLILYCVVGGCVRPRGADVFALAGMSLAVGYLVSVIWAMSQTYGDPT